MKTRIAFMLYLCMSASLCAQKPAESPHDIAERQIATQLAVYPQEKIHLHTDRDYYIPGERIWFKAYLADAATHQPVTSSRYVYVELINEADSVVSRAMVRPENDLYYGQIFLGDVLPEGYYTMRAYTRYMENPEEDYFFRKRIRIGSITPEEEAAKQKKKQEKIREDYVVSFFPEGGNFPAGHICRIAFKAINTRGYAEEVSGEVTDESGEVITTAASSHAGMGNFLIQPEKGKRYFFRTTNAKGVARQFELPQAQEQAYSLSANIRGKRLSVARVGDTDPAPEHILLIHCRGQVLFCAEWEKGKTYYGFPEEQLPSGVIQILLLDKDMNTLSERLIFSKQADQASLAFETDKSDYRIRERVSSRLRLTDNTGKPLHGNLSVAITDDYDGAVDHSTTILSTLLLSSELKGYIESPGYYFEEGEDPRRELALDNLMMTQGWRRYALPDVLKGEIAQPAQPFEDAKSVSGVIKRYILNKPVVGGEVLLVAMSAGMILSAESDSTGRFTFDNLEYSDSLNFYLQARNMKQSDNVRLFVDEEPVQAGKSLPYRLSLLPKEAPDLSFMEKARERSKYDEDIRVIHLKELEIIGKKKDKEQELREQTSPYAKFTDSFITREEIERRNPVTISQMFRGLPGIRVLNNGHLQIRGSAGYPLYMVDGMIMESSLIPDSGTDEIASSFSNPLNMIPVSDIERVEIFRGTKAALFGGRGAMGAINVITRRGEASTYERHAPNRTSLSRLGFQTPIEFYSPMYATEEQRFSITPDLRTTLWWKPDLVTSATGEASFEFYAADTSTTYSVVIEGLTDDGKIVRKVEKISVK